MVSFQTSDEPLIEPSTNQTHRSLSTLKRSQEPAYVQPFPINSLAPAFARPEPPRPHHPLTPPPEDDVEMDGMDWTPSQPSASTFNPPQSFRPTPAPAPAQPGPSPFYGRLPLAPISPAHALLNPPDRPVLRKNSAQAKQNFFNQMTNREGSPDSVATEATEAFEENLSPQKLGGIFEMSRQRFFPNMGEKVETGLESLFNGSFKIGDEKVEKRAQKDGADEPKTKMAVTTMMMTPAKVVSIRGLQMVLSCATCFACWAATTNPRLRKPLRLFALGSVAALAGRGLLTTCTPEREFWSLSDIFIYGVELALAIFLGNRVQQATGMEELDASMMSHWLVGFTTLQQAILFIYEGRALLAQSKAARASNDDGKVQNDEQEENPVPIFSTSKPTSDKSSFSQPPPHDPPKSTLSSFSKATRPQSRTQAKTQPQSIRKSKTKPARESVGSTGFSGLSLGLGGEASPQPMSSALVRTEPSELMATPKFSTWAGSGQQDVVRRSGRIRDQGAPWGKGTI